jgi:hypothetical protein
MDDPTVWLRRLSMGMADTVRSLAEAVAQVKSLTNPRHRICVELLRLMPEYLEIHRLDGWEEAYQDALEPIDDASETGVILWEVFEFGRLNMYGAFNPKLTVKEFARLSSWLTERGINVPTPGDLTDW